MVLIGTIAANALAVTSGNVATDVADVAVLVAFAAVGYFFAQRTRRVIGTTPWRLPAVAWAIVSGLLPIWGLMLEWIARLTTRPAGGPGQAPGFGRPGAGRSSVDPRSYPGQGYPGPGFDVTSRNPAGGPTPWPTAPPSRPGPGGWVPPTPAPSPAPGVPAAAANGFGANEAGAFPGAGLPAPTPPPLFGWYADPDERHEERYWDGRQWSELVRDAGAVSTDPLQPFGAPGFAPRAGGGFALPAAPGSGHDDGARPGSPERR